MPIAPIMPPHVRPLAPLDAEVTDFDLMNLMPIEPNFDIKDTLYKNVRIKSPKASKAKTSVQKCPGHQKRRKSLTLIRVHP